MDGHVSTPVQTSVSSSMFGGESCGHLCLMSGERVDRLVSTMQVGVSGGDSVHPKPVDYYRASQMAWQIRKVGLRTHHPIAAITQFQVDKTGRIDILAHNGLAGRRTNLLTGYDYAWDRANRLTEMRFTHQLFQNESVNAYQYNDQYMAADIDQVFSFVENQ